MKMTKEQYRMANGAVLPVTLFILAYMTLVIAGVVMGGAAGVQTYIQLIVNILCIIVAIIGFVSKREEKIGGIIILGSVACAYFVMMCVSNASITYVYAFPIMFCTVVYMNVKFMKFGNAVLAVAMVINVARLSMKGILSSDQLVVQVMTTLLCICAAYVVMRILERFNKENIEVIQTAAKQQNENAAKALHVAEQLIEQFEQAQNTIDVLSENIEVSNESMKNIADSTESTAQAIQQQAVMCGEIHTNTELANEEDQSYDFSFGNDHSDRYRRCGFNPGIKEPGRNRTKSK